MALHFLRKKSDDDIDRRHVVPLAVAAAHTISGVAILAAAHGVMQTTPLYILGLLVNDPTAASILIVTALLAVILYLTQADSLRLHDVAATTAVLVADAFRVGGYGHRLWAISRWLYHCGRDGLHPHRPNLATGDRGRAHLRIC
jgi:hypothetical protein